MTALNTLFPIFFMIILGFISKVKGWITPEQSAGANSVIFGVLFPIMIFNVLFTSSIDVSAIPIVAYVFICFLIAFVIGKFAGRFINKDYAHIIPFMLPTVEGGNVALPLYTAIVGMQYASNTVVFDLAGVMMAFIVIPIIVAISGGGDTSPKQMVKNIVTSPFIIAVVLGLGLNLCGVYKMLQNSAFIDLYNGTLANATAPIVSVILFCIGYDLSIDMETLPSVLKVLLLRLAFYIAVILGFFVLFPTKMADPLFKLAAFVYFTCPWGFAIPLQISPLYEKDEDSKFASAFISLGMILTLIIYTCIVIFVA